MKFHDGRMMCIHIILAFVLFYLPGNQALGAVKVLERSSKKIPEWVGSNPSDHLVVIAYGETLKDAQDMAEQDLIRRVIGAVGMNVESETVADSGVEGDKEWDDFRSRLAVRAAKLPFVSDITLSKCIDTYWEHISEKDSGNESYRFYALYPFSAAARQVMIGKYEAYDKNMEDTLNRFESDYEDVGSFEDLSMAEGELEGLLDWFPDNLRRSRAKKTLELYRQIRRSLVLVGEITSKGECKVSVLRGDRLFKLAGRLKATSNCANQIQITPDASGWTVRFNTEDCLKYEENSLNLTLNCSGINLKTTVSF